MASINTVTLVGRVGQDPDYRRFDNGGEQVEFSLATSETWRDRNSGERKERTQWHRVKIQNENVVKIARDYVRKGALVGIEGVLEYREWEKDGQKHRMAEVVIKPFAGKLHLLGSKDENGGSGNSSGGRSERRNDDYGSSRGGGGNSYGGGRSSGGGGGASPGRSGYSSDLDDDIPFAPEWR